MPFTKHVDHSAWEADPEKRQLHKDPEFLCIAHLSPLGSKSAHNYRLSPYIYRILACTNTASCPPAWTNRWMPRSMTIPLQRE